jgi:hypothetical protein
MTARVVKVIATPSSARLFSVSAILMKVVVEAKLSLTLVLEFDFWGWLGTYERCEKKRSPESQGLKDLVIIVHSGCIAALPGRLRSLQ